MLSGMNRLFLVLLLFLASCAAPPRNHRPDHPRERAQIQIRLNEILDAAVKKDLPRLDSYHLYGPKFSKFSPETPGLQDAAMARKGEHDGLLGANGLTMRADDLRLDLFGNVAITTFILHYSFKTGTGEIKKQARTTMVFVKDRGAWKIAHEHLSAVPSS
jgi:hypothetical protein